MSSFQRVVQLKTIRLSKRTLRSVGVRAESLNTAFRRPSLASIHRYRLYNQVHHVTAGPHGLVAILFMYCFALKRKGFLVMEGFCQKTDIPSLDTKSAPVSGGCGPHNALGGVSVFGAFAIWTSAALSLGQKNFLPFLRKPHHFREELPEVISQVPGSPRRTRLISVLSG